MVKRLSSSKHPKKPAVENTAPELERAPRPEPPSRSPGQDRSHKKSKIRELSWAQFDRLVQALAKEILGGFKPDAVVGIAHGGVFVGGALASALGCDFFPVRISRRSRDKQVRRTPKLSGEMPRELEGRRVLVVDDVAASGDTLELALALAGKVGPKAIAAACLVSKPDGYQPKWAALTTEDFVVFPWDYEPVAEDARFDVDPDKAGA